MKKHLLFNVIFISAVSSAVYAQNPTNNSFDNWTQVATYEDPVGWTTYNSYTPSTPTTVKTSPAFEGSFAMKLQVVNDALLGVNTGYAQGNFSMNSRPTTLGWYSKSNIALTGDSVSLSAVFYSGGSPIGAATWAQGASVTNYTQVIVPISYLNSAIPDSVIIYIWAGDDLNFMVGTNLIIDKMEFDPVIDNTGIQELSNIHNINFFPNPSKDQVNISFSSERNDKLDFKIYNTLGQTVLCDSKNVIQGNNEFICNISELQKGVYFMMLENGNEKTQVKLIKE